jgi:23S rRNA pseudouridine955/2504/2580 synthase
MSMLSKDAVTRLTVGDEAQGQRLDNYLARVLKGVPKSHIYRIVRSGEVRVNRHRAEASTRLEAGDELRIPPVRARASGEAAVRTAPPGLAMPPILYEDDALIAVDKPAGVAVHGGSGISFGVIERLRIGRPDARFLELVHRLDRETSGVLLVAKKRGALVDLHAQLREGKVEKRYRVLVRGRWRDAMRRVDLPLHATRRDGEKRVHVAREGRPSATIFRRERGWPELDPPLALLEAELETGRTHQIRVHLTHLGFPLAGDDKYGDFAWNRELARLGLKRMFLHAASVRFVHPTTGELMTVQAPLPDDLAGFLTSLDASERGQAQGAA